MVLRALPRRWRRVSLPVRLALVIAVAGAVMGATPVVVALSELQAQAAGTAGETAGIAANLMQAQQQSLAAYADAVAVRIGAATADPAAVRAALVTADAGDTVAVAPEAAPLIAMRDGSPVASRDAQLTSLIAVANHGGTIATVDGTPWLLGSASLRGGGTVMAARPVTPGLLAAIARSLTTSSGGHGSLAVTDSGHVIAGTMPLRGMVTATLPIGARAAVVVGVPVDSLAVAWQELTVLGAVMLVAVLVVAGVARSSLQRPLRRLNRALARLTRGDFDQPITVEMPGELQRLATTVDSMRVQLRSVLRVSEARAAIATELNTTQPLHAVLQRVCDLLREAMEVDAAAVVVDASEIGDPFTVGIGFGGAELTTCLHGHGPLGAGFRLHGDATLVARAGIESTEGRFGFDQFCVAPLRMGSRVHGVMVVARRGGEFPAAGRDLLSAAAMHVAIALERYRMLAAAQLQATEDDLTGLHNHRFFVDSFGQQLALAQRMAAPLTLLLLDIDHFKSVNDTYGHQAGDAVLRAFGETLRRCIRKADFAARYGGEEFVVIMSDTGALQARLVAEKIREAVERSAVTVDAGRTIAVTVSIGLAAFPGDALHPDQLVKLADEALYRAKRTGRNRVCAASDVRSARRRRQRRVVHTAAAPPLQEEHAAPVTPLEQEHPLGTGGAHRPSQ